MANISYVLIIGLVSCHVCFGDTNREKIVHKCIMICEASNGQPKLEGNVCHCHVTTERDFDYVMNSKKKAIEFGMKLIPVLVKPNEKDQSGKVFVRVRRCTGFGLIGARQEGGEGGEQVQAPVEGSPGAGPDLVGDTADSVKESLLALRRRVQVFSDSFHHALGKAANPPTSQDGEVASPQETPAPEEVGKSLIVSPIGDSGQPVAAASQDEIVPSGPVALVQPSGPVE